MTGFIQVTRSDFDSLYRLIHNRRAGRFPDQHSLDTLQEELERAEIVDPHALPNDVVTMNSEVRLKDLDSGDVKTYRLVFPMQARAQNGISILAPIGTALLGYRAGDVIEWRVPKGIRRLKVLEVLSQPEALSVRGS